MAVKAINTSDLLNLEIKLKWELQEEIKTRHHSLVGKVQEDYNKMDSKISSYNTEVLLNKQSLQRMEKDIEDIKEMLSEFIKSIPIVYATKEDHKRNEERIIDLEKDRKNILVETAKWFILALLWIGVSVLMYKLWLK